MLKHLSTPLVLALLASAAQAQTGRGISFDRVQHGPAAAPETGFPSGAVATHSGPGADFLQVSTSTRTSGIASPPQNCPFTLNIPALPPGAVVIDTLISWTYLANAIDGTDQININGTPLIGAQLGNGAPDLCWGKGFGVTYLATGATGLVNIGGANTIDGACDGPGAGDPTALGEGITILIIYEVPAANTVQTVDVFAGYTSSTSSATGTALATLDLSCAYSGGAFHFMVNADDGQQASDQFFINGVDVSGLVAGTGVPGDAWQGLSGPAAIDNLYDVADDDIQTWMTVGDTSVTIESGFGSDCVAHSLAAAAYVPDSACTPCSIIPFCSPFTGSFNNTATITSTGCDLGSSVVLTLGNATPGELTYLIFGNGQSLIVNPPDALGDLCVAGGPKVARYWLDVGAVDGSGNFSTDISNSLTGGPGFGLPLYGGSIQAGETWYFQYWTRNTGNPHSFSEAVGITFN
jgi:hypothetical protein